MNPWDRLVELLPEAAVALCTCVTDEEMSLVLRDLLIESLERVEVLKSDLNECDTKYAESINELDLEVQALKAELAHAIEVKNRCVAAINKLCSQVVELQAQLGSKE